MQRGLFLALILVVWLGLDFNGLMMSVLGTYFFFGKEGMPLHMPLIGLVGLLTSCGPFLYWLFLMRRNVSRELESLVALQLAAYFLCAFVRHTDVFAWTTVFGTLVSGLALVSLLRRLREFAHFEVPVLGFFLAFLLQQWAQVLDDGLMVVVRPIPILAAVPVVLFALVLVHGRAAEAPPASRERPLRSLQVSTVAMVLIIDVAIALLANFNLWSAKTPWAHAAVYSGSFGLGTAAGFLTARRLASTAAGLPLLLAGGAAGTALALFVVLHLSYGLPLGLVAHGAGCYGLGVFLYLYIRRFKEHLDRSPGSLPIAGMQIGALVSLLVLGSFLKTSNPVGFWVAFAVGAALLSSVEVRRPTGVREAVPALRMPAWIALLPLPILPALLYAGGDSEPLVNASDEPELTVMTTNARYGWTDDYRFEPEPYVEWLAEHPAAIIGMQEVNKGNFYGGFTDDFEYYRKRLPGRAIYGDANYGFGNALFTSLKVLESSVRPFSDNDMIRRSYIHALVEHGGREIDVFVAHVAHKPPPNPTRARQVGELVEQVRGAQRPWILMGDLNAGPDQDEIKELALEAHPVFQERPELLTKPTYPSYDPPLRLDYVFFSNHFELVDDAILDNEGTSDHRPVRVTLRLAR